MKKKFFDFPFHTILFSIYPILFFYSKNTTMFNGISVIRWPVILSVAVVLFLMLLGRAFFKSIDRVAFVLSLLVISIYSTGYIAELIYGRFRKEHALIYAIVIVIFGVLVSVFIKKSFRPLTQILNIVACILILGPIYTVFVNYRDTNILTAKKEGHSDMSLVKNGFAPNISADSAPDVYYIILDAYSRHDALKKYYDYDNEWFVAELEKRGFYVAKNSCSNYHSTVQSLASSTSGAYLQSMSKDTISNWDVFCSGVFKVNPVFSHFHDNGYKVYNIISGFQHLQTQELGVADITFSPFGSNSSGSVNFMFLLTKQTLVRILYRYNEKHNSGIFMNPFEWYAFSTDFQFFMLPRTPRVSVPKFIFSHVLCPHTPYYYNSEGAYDVRTAEVFNVDNFPIAGYSLEDWSRLYSQQVHALNHKFLRAVDEILARSSKPPIIIVQGDHGSRFIEPTLGSHFPILNAYLVPSEMKAMLYESISPVNSFRVLFNYLFGAKLEILPDKSYFNDDAAPMRLRDRTAELVEFQQKEFGIGL